MKFIPLNIKNFFFNLKYKKNKSKKIDIFIDILQGKEKYVSELSITEQNDIVIIPQHDNISQQNKKFGIIVVGTALFSSLRTLKLYHNLAIQGYSIVFVLNKSFLKKENYKKAIKKFFTLQNVKFIFTSRAISIKNRLELSIKEQQEAYYLFFTLSDYINIQEIQKIENEINFNDVDIVFPSRIKNMNTFTCYASSLSGIIFSKNILKEYFSEDTNLCSNYWLFYDFFMKNDKKNILYTNYRLSIPYFPLNINNYELAAFTYDSFQIISNMDSIKVNDFAHKIILIYIAFFQEQIQNKKRKNKAIITCSVIFLAYLQKKIDSISYEYLMRLLSDHYNYSEYCKSKGLYIFYDEIIKKLYKIKKIDFAIIETAGMAIVKDSPLFSLLQEKYQVEFIEKKQFIDYYPLLCLVIRARLEQAKIVITSGGLHKKMIGKRNFYNLWHGLGILKKTVVNIKNFRLGKIICSSEECINIYAQHFSMEKNELLALGAVQTDILFDLNYKLMQRKRIREKYNISLDSKIVFFAPTFRLEKNPYYNFNIDIEELSKELEKNNFYMLVKKHHVFYSLLSEKGIDSFGILGSKNKHIIVVDDEDFIPLLCSSDVFMSDYSSGIFQAICLKLPLVLYAPDYQEYAIGKNGFYINYPDDIPAKYVLQPSIKLLIEAILTSKELITSEKYDNFRKYHIGACDGKVTEKLFKYFEDELNF